jgi:hypothetical protein
VGTRKQRFCANANGASCFSDSLFLCSRETEASKYFKLNMLGYAPRFHQFTRCVFACKMIA